MKIPFVGPTYESLSVRADCQRSINLYPEVIESGTGRNVAALYGTPGLVAFGSVDGPIRGMWVGESRLFVVGGATLYEIASDGSPTDLGDVGPGDGTPVTMAGNGQQLLVTSGGQAYLHDGVTLHTLAFPALEGTVNVNGDQVTWVSGDKFAQSFVGKIIVIAGTNYTVESVEDSEHLTLTTFTMTMNGASYTQTETLTAAACCYLDGFFVIMKGAGYRTFYWSAPMNGLSWSALDYANKEAQPDALAMVFSDHEDLWLFGTQSTEVWRANYSTSPTAKPWDKDPSAFIHYGAVPWTVCRLRDGVAWLAIDPRGYCVAVRAQGYLPVRVTTHAIEQAWNKYSTVMDAEAFAYTEDGHYFWVINFPTGNATWVYDATTQFWHERAYGASLDRARPRCHGYVWNKHIVGDYSTGALYQSSLTAYTDAGTAIKRIRTCPVLAEENKRGFYHRFQLDAEQGLGLDPVLDYSNDGGKTYVASRAPQHADVAGQYGHDHQFSWWRLGSGGSRVFRTTITAACKVALVNGYVDMEVGLH